MHFEAAQFNNAIQSFYDMLDKWDKDLSGFEDIITKKKEAGEAVAGMEINLMKGNQRYKVAMQMADAAIVYIKAMQLFIDTDHHKAVELKILQKKIQEIERRYRVKFHEM